MAQNRVGDGMSKPLNSVASLLRRILPGSVMGSRSRRIRLCETLSLGERRFLALVRVDQQQFLIGGAGNSVALLAQLPSSPVPEGEQLNSMPSLAAEGARRDSD